MLTTKDSSNFNRGNANYEGILNEKSKVEKSSLVIVMLTTKDSANFNSGKVNYEGILDEKK